MAVQKDIGFILRSFNFRETSKIAYIYTRQRGKIGGLFKGFRLKRQHFSTPLDIFSLNEFVYYPSRSNLHLVSAAELIDNYSYLRDIPSRFYLASYMMELVDRIMPFHYPQEEIFGLIKVIFDNFSTYSLANSLAIFQIKILNLTGFRPSLTTCLRCSHAVEKEGYFSFRLGGMLCLKCFSADPQADKVSADIIASLRYMRDKDFPQVYNLKPSPSTMNSILKMLDAFISYHLQARLRSKIFLEVFV